MKSRNVLLFLLTVGLLLALVYWLMPADGVRIGSLTLRTPRLSQMLQDEEVAPKVDTLELVRLQQHRDSIELFHQWKDSSTTRFWFPNDDETFFDGLFAAMETAAKRGRHLRVMHYGDSQIEMDHISSRLRSALQDLFGGSGPGMVSLQTIASTPAVAKWSDKRLPRLASFGDSLSVHSNGNYGPMAQCFRLVGNTTVSYRMGHNRHCDPKVGQCSQVGLIYRPHKQTALLSTLSVQAPWNKSATQSDEQLWSTDSLVVMDNWYLDSAATRIRMTLNGAADVYGVLLDGDPGVMVDNIAMRGCSGQQFTQIDHTLLTDAYALLDVGLIILQFGGNSVPYIRTQKKLDTYCNNIGRQIDYLHTCCPNAVILFVGPSDMTEQRNEFMQTYPFLENIIEGLRATANEHGAAFWSIYHAMGGYNSMKHWVKQGWAGSDYIHFSQKGADKMGDMMADALKTLYQYYLLRHDTQPIEP